VLKKYEVMIMSKRNGFTLAEVLITLGIIGIVAALTIPSLINNYQKRVIESRLKEDYSILTQVMRRAQNDDVPFDDYISQSLSGNKKWFETFIIPYMKIGRICYAEAGCWHNKGATRNLAGNTIYANHNEIGIGQKPVTIRLTNGSNLNFDWYSSGSMKTYFGIDVTQTAMIIFIDANGDSPPNIIGKDIYVMAFIPDYGFIPAGFHESNEIVENNCSPKATEINAGYYCLQKVKNNGWEIPKEIWKIKK